MSAPACKVTLPDFVREHGDRLRRYHRQHPGWGALHVCLEDGNWWAVDEEWAVHIEQRTDGYGDPDPEGAALVRLVMQLSESQRARLEAHLYPERT